MKRTIALLFALMLVSSVCFSQPVSSVNSPGPRPAGKTEIFSGEVMYISLANPVKGTKTQIGVKDAQGEQHSFIVNDKTVIYDKAGKNIALDKIVKGNKVAIEYKFDSTKAKTIKLAP